jgi:ATP:corrinoid adenosyltransferase
MRKPGKPDGDHHRARLSSRYSEIADTVSELRPVNMPAGVKAQIGIDY